METRWLALMIGNSRMHWALFENHHLLQTWHLPHLDPRTFQAHRPQNWSQWQTFLPPFFASDTSGEDPHAPYPELWLVSVVPAQAELWIPYPSLTVLNLTDVPLQDVYPGLGLDRAIALWGAGNTYGWPCLVIDGGTALTLTGADASASLIGGAILPGLTLQFHALASSTAALKWVELPQTLPALWGNDTETAIQSGIVQGAIAGVRHAMTQWLKTYPDSKIVFTGGDAEQFSTYMEDWILQYEALDQNLNRFITDPALIFKGVQALRRHQLHQ